MNNAVFPEYTIHTAYALLPELTGINMKEHTFREFANICLSNRIGHNTMPLKMKCPVQENGIIYLPCEAKKILAVADNAGVFNTWEHAMLQDGMISYNRMGDIYKDWSPSVRQGMRTYVDFGFYPPNRLRVDPQLSGEDLYVLAEAKIKDHDGNHLINMKQVEAIVWFCAYLKTQRDMFAGIQSGIDLNFLKNKSQTAIDDAKVPEYVTDNELDAMMNAKTSFGRKRFNKDYMF